MNSSAKDALSRFKYEVASELGVNLKQGYNGDLTSRQNGSVGGEMVKRMIAHAEQSMSSGSSMPWEAPLQSILESVEGPVAKIVAVIIIIVTGLTLAFGDTGGGFRRLIQIVFGISIAFAASSFFLSFFSFGGGALI